MVKKKLTKAQEILKHPATTKTDSPKIRELKHEARRYNIKEGIYDAVKCSFGTRFVSPFAIAINSSNAMVAMLSSISGLLNPLSQIFGSRLTEKYSRKKILVNTVGLNLFFWLSLILIATLYYKNILTGVLPLAFLLFFALHNILEGLGHPAWFSWTGDLVDENYRGRWFSKRKFLLESTAIVTAVIASFLLDYFKARNLTMIGFMVLFSVAFGFKSRCVRLFTKQYEPKINLKKGDYIPFSNFILNANKNNFGKFALFNGILSLATYISSPLLVIYLLRELQFTYTTYIVVTLAGTLFSLFVLELWGKLIDKYGSYRILSISASIIPLVPILWILSTSPLYLFLIPSIVSGVAWSGFQVASRDFIYSNVEAKKSGLFVSYFNLLNGAGIFIGAGIGAILIKFLIIDIVKPIIAIFIFGSIVRAISVMWWIPKIKEIKKTHKFNQDKIISEIFNSLKPTIEEETHQLISIKKYINMP